MELIAQFLKASKSVNVKDNFVFVTGTENELDVYIDFFDDNDWLWVNDTMYKKSLSKLTERDKMKLKTDFFFDFNSSSDDDEIIRYYKSLNKNFNYLSINDCVLLLSNAFQFNLTNIPSTVKTLLRKIQGVEKGNFYTIKFDEMTKQNLKNIIDKMRDFDTRQTNKYD